MYQGDISGKKRILFGDVVHAVVGIHTVLGEQGHTGGDQKGNFPLVDTHQAVGLDPMLPDTLGVELTKAGDLTAHATLLRRDTIFSRARSPLVFMRVSACATVFSTCFDALTASRPSPILTWSR